VANPGDTNLALTDFWKLRRGVTTGTLDEERRNQDAGEKITLVPVRVRA